MRRLAAVYRCWLYYCSLRHNYILCCMTISWAIVCSPHGVTKSEGHKVYPKKYAHGFCFAVLCCGYTLTDFPISIRLTSLALWQSNDCPSSSKATLMNMDKYFMWIHYERLRNHNKAKHNKTVCIFLGIYCTDVISGNALHWSSVQEIHRSLVSCHRWIPLTKSQ